MLHVVETYCNPKPFGGKMNNTEELQKLYTSNEAAKALGSLMASRQRNQNVTKLRRVEFLLKANGYEISRPDLIAVFRKLEELDCGQYVEGRRGWLSRFVWSVSSIDVFRAAMGEPTQIEALEHTEDDDDLEKDTLEHSFNLRADLQIKFSLPTDLSATEAERLAAFIKTLPLEEYE
jgi:hypothetical protein